MIIPGLFQDIQIVKVIVHHTSGPQFGHKVSMTGPSEVQDRLVDNVQLVD